MKQAVFIINSLQNGGAERVVVTQAAALQRAGYDVTIILLRNWKQYELAPGIRTVCLTGNQRFGAASYGVYLPKLVARLNRTLDLLAARGEIDLITAHLLFPHVVTRMSKYADRTIYVLHSMQNIVPFAGLLPYRKLIRWLYQGQQVVAISNAIRRELHSTYHVSSKTMRTIYNPLDFQAIREKAAEPVEHDRPFLLFCGRLNPVKRPEWAIEAFVRGEFYKEYDLVVLGVGELREKLDRQVQESGVGKYVHFLGWEMNVYKWMSAASLLVLTSKSEGLAMALVEALYCGCPIVSVDCPGSAELLQGALAPYLCEQSVDALIETMRRALKEYPGDLQRFALKFSVEKNIRRYLDAYKEWNAEP